VTNAKALQSLYKNTGKIGGYYMPENDSETSKFSFEFMLKCRQCRWWRHSWCHLWFTAIKTPTYT